MHQVNLSAVRRGWLLGLLMVWILFLGGLDFAAAQTGTPQLWSADWRPNSNQFAVSYDQGSMIYILEFPSGQIVKTIPINIPRYPQVSFATGQTLWSPDGNRLFTVAANYEHGAYFLAIDYDSGQTLWTIDMGEDRITSVALSQDGQRLAVATEEGMGSIVAVDELHIWDTQTGQEIATWRMTSLIRSLTWKPDGTQIAGIVGATTTATIWDAATGAEIMTLSGFQENMDSLDWSPDGSQIAASGFEGTRIYDTVTGQTTTFFVGDSKSVSTIEWNPDGTKLLIDAEPFIRVWDTSTGQLSPIIFGHEFAAWNGDGTQVITTSDRTSLLFYDTAGTQVATLTPDIASIPTPTPSNLAPIARAGTYKLVTDTDGNGSEEVLLDGRASTDSDGSVVSYEWLIDRVPTTTGATALVTLDVGTHTITLTITDDDTAFAWDETTITVRP